MSFSHVYSLPYRQQGDQTEVLVAFKQVVSFEGVAKRLHNFDSDTWRRIDFSNPLKVGGPDDGKVNLCGDGPGQIGKRFNGVLLPAGGKPAFLGGEVKCWESAKRAVIHQFIEEAGLDDVKISDDAVGHPFYTTDWSGAYFALDVKKHMMNFDWENHLTRINSGIKEFEDNADLSAIAEAGFVRWLYPMQKQKLTWVNANELVNTMSTFDAANMHGKIQKFSTFLFNLLKVEKDVNLFAGAVENYMSQQPIDSNVKAARRFIEL